MPHDILPTHATCPRPDPGNCGYVASQGKRPVVYSEVAWELAGAGGGMADDRQEPATERSAITALPPHYPQTTESGDERVALASEPSADGAISGRRRNALNFLREFVETILLTLVIFVAVRTLVVNFRVDGESMRPSLQNGQYLLVNRAVYFHFNLNTLRNLLPGPDRQDQDIVYLFHPPQRGDIIVFDPPVRSDKPYIKRVIGLPGDRIAVRDDHRVYVNGQPIEERYIAAPPRQVYPLGGGEYTVPPGMIFVMGDNRNNSQDSRIFSAVSLNSVIGKAFISYWPLDGFGLIPHERYAAAIEAH
jgi:signal peptidase I